ncbi:hypothetical protein HDU98_006541 [Podochytrium sp. JEL0797]|nr:hypothetical protein HDU98_006541 [Podochytrium sp. JEL0797]
MTATAATRNIFVAIDESSHAVGAFSWALDNIATGANDRVTAVVILEHEAEREQVLERTKTLIRAFAVPNHLNAKYSVQILTVSGFQKVGHRICELIDEAKPDMLILGSAGKTHLEGMLIGSTSNYCISHANCPVIVARVTPADELRAQQAAAKSGDIAFNHPIWV